MVAIPRGSPQTADCAIIVEITFRDHSKGIAKTNFRIGNQLLSPRWGDDTI